VKIRSPVCFRVVVLWARRQLQFIIFYDYHTASLSLNKEHRINTLYRSIMLYMLIHLSYLDTANGARISQSVEILGRSKIFLYSTVSRPALGPTQVPSQWMRVSVSLGVKRPGSEADHLPPSSAKVKKGETITTLPHTSSVYTA
jgi:hypothetical protein